ncbi:MAG: antibiotic biosynthesis monooxygenase [Deltaproteobacteria bacterium]|jgi:quinol monooxygenase YgiN|nr:antibiotic biosynthesis monooxygenase [Deltaproteobacteria bacterium]
MDKYYIVAFIYPKPGKEEALKAEILGNIPNVRKEKGNIRYDLHELKADGTKFMFYEIWADKAAFDGHLTAPHMLAYRERIKDIIAAPTEVGIWSAVDVSV